MKTLHSRASMTAAEATLVATPRPTRHHAQESAMRRWRTAAYRVAFASCLTWATFGISSCASTTTAQEVSSASTPAEAGLVDIRILVPDIAQDIRYAGRGNFVGERIDGYHAPRCYLLRPVAEALQRVELDLRAQDLRLKIFDCYRPVQAVRHFVRWAGDLTDQRSKPQYYPNLDKRALLGDYIAPVSGHSRGATVDLTLMQCAPGGVRCEPLDMGTDFDFFDQRANTDSPLATSAQRDTRKILRAAMTRHGFRNYSLEWWHYTLVLEPPPGVAFDVPVQ
ncbi:MAG: M15 family metallopeptidase [Gammaproteobacteria bacterium]|nr:M15 family metallopeptidase [Gammaproteobacteria bacterium]